MQNFFKTAVFLVLLAVSVVAVEPVPAINLCGDALQWELSGTSSDYCRLENAEIDGKPSLRLLYDFKAMGERDRKLVIKLKRTVALENASRFAVQIRDEASGQRLYFMCHDAKGKRALFSYTENDLRTLRHSGWKEYSFSPGTDRCDVWGGNPKESKELAYPLQLESFWLDPVNRNHLKGELLFAQMTLDGRELTSGVAKSSVEKESAERKPELTVKGRFYGTLAWTGDREELTVRFTPGSRTLGKCEEEIAFLDADGNLVKRLKRPVNVAGTLDQTVALPEEVTGYYQMRYRLSRDGEVLFESRAVGGMFAPVEQPAPAAARLGMGFWGRDCDEAFFTLRKMGIRFVRIDLGWSWIEPRKGEFKWDSSDRLLDAAEKNGLSVLATTQYIPKWAAQKPYHQYGGDPDPAEWEAFYRRIIERYGKKIAVYEVWNEPDTPYHWSGGAAAYAKHLERTAKVIRELAPNALIAHAGLTGEEKLWRPFSVALMESKVGDFFDIYSFHYGKGESAPLHRKLLNDAGLGRKRIWNTESGWGTPEERILQIVRDFAAGVEKSFYFEFQSKVRQFSETSMMTPDFQPNRIMPMFLALSRLLDNSFPVAAVPFPGGEAYRIAPETVLFLGNRGTTFFTDRKQVVYTTDCGRETTLYPVDGFFSVPSSGVSYVRPIGECRVSPAMIEFAENTALVAGTRNRVSLSLHYPGKTEFRGKLKLFGSAEWDLPAAETDVVLKPNEKKTVSLELQPDLLASRQSFRCDAILEKDGKPLALQTFSGVVQAPIHNSVQAVFADGRPGVRVRVRNLLDQSLDAEIALKLPASWNCDRQTKVALTPKGEAEFTASLPGGLDIRKDRSYFVDVITTALGVAERDELRLNWIGIPAVKPETPWEQLPLEAEIRERSEFVPDRAILETWLGPDDLSCRFYWGWSSGLIRMRWVVTDDRHVNSEKSAFAWNGDSVQLWYDGRLYDLARIDGENVIYAHEEKPDGDRLSLEVRRSGSETVYQLEIRPGAGRTFAAGTNFPFSFCVNDNDGDSIRKGWMFHFAKTGSGGERKNSPIVTLMGR